jgi:hypothetical protein
MATMIRVPVLLAALALGVVFLGAHAGTAHAYDRMWIQNLKTGKCLADPGEHNSVPNVAVSWTCLHPYERREQWIRSGMGNGGYRFQNVYTGRCLDYNQHDGLRTFPCHPAFDQYAAFQSWSTNSAGSSSRFRMQAFVGHGCLADYSTGLNMSGCVTAASSSYANQVWMHYTW